MKDGYGATGYASSMFCTRHVLDHSPECPSKRLEFDRGKPLVQYASLDVRNARKSSLMEKLRYKDTRMAFVLLLWVILEEELL
jgi:hypothetical protein